MLPIENVTFLSSKKELFQILNKDVPNFLQIHHFPSEETFLSLALWYYVWRTFYKEHIILSFEDISPSGIQPEWNSPEPSSQLLPLHSDMSHTI